MPDASEPRKPGRPKAEEPSTMVSTWIPASEHDRLIRLAHRREQSVSKTVRQLLKPRLSE